VGLLAKQRCLTLHVHRALKSTTKPQKRQSPSNYIHNLWILAVTALAADSNLHIWCGKLLSFSALHPADSAPIQLPILLELPLPLLLLLLLLLLLRLLFQLLLWLLLLMMMMHCSLVTQVLLFVVQGPPAYLVLQTPLP
jgi:hypothetical protein